MTTSEETALYRIHGVSQLLYIGTSNNFGRRWKEHARRQSWWPKRRSMTVDWYDTRDEALDAEALAIFTEQPKHNVLHRKQARRLRRVQRQRAATTAVARDPHPAREDPNYLALLGTPEYEALVRSASAAAEPD